MHHNSKILKQFDYDLDHLVESHPNSDLSCGSEFRPISILAPLLHRHHHWDNFSSYCTSGFNASFKPLSESQRLKDVNAAIARGNHKSAKKHINILRKNTKKEIYTGFIFPFKINDVKKIKGAMVAPQGVAVQDTINELGEIVPKHRPTCDQSFEFSPGNSVNKLLRKDLLPGLCYGHCLLRILHCIHALRTIDLNRPILISKLDFKSAYRRGTMKGELAAKSIMILCGFALLLRCLPFGGSHCPNLWCVVSEFVTDLANDLLSCEDWNENEIFSPHIDKLAPPDILDSAIPFTQAKPADASVQVSDHGCADIFIDDIITVGFHSKRWRRLCGATLLALHMFGRPAHENEPVPRNDLVALNKLLAAGSPSEIKTVLGWDIDTRRLLVSLPDDKFEEWCAQIQKAIDSKSISPSDLESLIGRLNHAAFVIPLSRHYLN